MFLLRGVKLNRVDIHYSNMVLKVLNVSITFPDFIIATAFINVEVRKGNKKVAIIKGVFKFCFIKNEQYFLSHQGLMPTALKCYCFLFPFREEQSSLLWVSSHKRTCIKSKLINTVLNNALPGKAKQMLEKSRITIQNYHVLCKSVLS